jgi:hypothetical protein
MYIYFPWNNMRYNCWSYGITKKTPIVLQTFKKLKKVKDSLWWIPPTLRITRFLLDWLIQMFDDVAIYRCDYVREKVGRESLKMQVIFKDLLIEASIFCRPFVEKQDYQEHHHLGRCTAHEVHRLRAQTPHCLLSAYLKS